METQKASECILEIISTQVITPGDHIQVALVFRDITEEKATEDEKAKYYGKVLELKGLVTKSQIKKQYIALIGKYHPDRVANMGTEIQSVAESKTKELNEAFDWFKLRYKI